MKNCYRIDINSKNFINFRTYWMSYESIKKAEKYYNSKYIGSFENEKGFVLDLFYNSEPDISKGHNQYFGLFCKFGKLLYITDGTEHISRTFNGLLLNSGEILVSGWNHDFHYAQNQNIFIDGGISYIRYGGDNLESVERVKLKMIDGCWNIIKDE